MDVLGWYLCRECMASPSTLAQLGDALTYARRKRRATSFIKVWSSVKLSSYLLRGGYRAGCRHCSSSTLSSVISSFSS